MFSDDDDDEDTTVTSEHIIDGGRRLSRTSRGKKAVAVRSARRQDQPGPRLVNVLFIQMDLCQKTLKEVISDPTVGDDQLWRLYRQMLEALVYIHRLRVVHRDLKPGNVFVDGVSILAAGAAAMAALMVYVWLGFEGRRQRLTAGCALYRARRCETWRLRPRHPHQPWAGSCG
jgi:serine/threonine protein kinase